MDLLLLSLAVALTNFIDVVINIIAARIIGLNIVEIGIMNAIWVGTYLISSRASDTILQRASARKLYVIGALVLSLSNLLLMLSLNYRSKQLVLYSYALHGIAAAALPISINTYIFEAYPSTRWQAILLKRNILGLFCEGLIFMGAAAVTMAALINNYAAFTAIATAITLLVALVLREPSLRIERTIFRIETLLDRLTVPAKGLCYLSFLSPYEVSALGSKLAVHWVSVPLILISNIAFRFGNEYLFTPLPYYLSVTAGFRLDEVLYIYGVARITSSALLSLIGASTYGPKLYALSIATRLLALLAVLQTRDTLALGALVGLIFVSNIIIDLNVYWLYVEARGGYMLGAYSFTGGLAIFAGSLTSGFLYATYGFGGLLMIIIFISTPLILLQKWVGTSSKKRLF